MPPDIPIRTFVAIELTPDLERAVRDLQTQLKQRLPFPALRWVQPHGIHLTLKFLGFSLAQIKEAEGIDDCQKLSGGPILTVLKPNSAEAYRIVADENGAVTMTVGGVAQPGPLPPITEPVVVTVPPKPRRRRWWQRIFG